MEGLLPPIVAELRGSITDFKTKMIEARGEMKGVAGEAGRTATQTRQHIGGSMVAIGAGMTAVGAVLNSVAKKQEDASIRLETAIKNTGASYDTYKGQVADAVHHQETFGHTSDETKNSLAALTAATQSPEKAMHLLGIATEIAAAKHISLEDASNKVVKVLGGSTRVLKEFGINVTKLADPHKALSAAMKQDESASQALAKAKQHLSDLLTTQHGKHKLTIQDHIALRDAQQKVKDATDKLKTAHQNVTTAQDNAKKSGSYYADVLNNQLMPRIHGTAEAMSGTFFGKLDMVKAKIMDVAGTVGKYLGPAFTVMGPIISTVGVVMMASATPAFGAMAGAIGAAASATMSFLVAWGPIILAIAAVGIAIYELVKHWKGAWEGIKAVAMAVWHFLDHDVFQPIAHFFTAVWQDIMTTAKAVWNDVWGVIKTVARVAWGVVKVAVIDPIRIYFGVIRDVVRVLGGVWAVVWRGIQVVVEGVWKVIGPIFRLVAAGLKDIIGLVDKITGIGKSPTGLSPTAVNALAGALLGPAPPQHRAGGGRVRAGSSYVVGELRPEMFVPDSNGTILPHTGGDTITNNITIYAAPGMDEEALADKVRDKLLLVSRRNGNRLGLA